MPARLNRRRYREVVAMLKEVISDKKQPAARRLQAGTTLLEVYARHDRTEAERTRRKAAASAQEPEPVETAAAAAADEPVSTRETVDEFLERVKRAKAQEEASTHE